MTPKDRLIDSPRVINITSRIMGAGELILGSTVTATGYDTVASNLNRYFDPHAPVIPVLSHIPEGIHSLWGSTGDGAFSAGLGILGCLTVGVVVGGLMHLFEKQNIQ